jgi:hypothetical protein
MDSESVVVPNSSARTHVSLRMARLLPLAAFGSLLLILPVAVILGPSQDTDGFKLLLGINQDELVKRGTLEYPAEDRSHNHQCHRLAARICTRRYGAIATLAGGIGNELVEALGLLSFGHNPLSRRHLSETWGDMSANLRGIRDAFQPKRRFLFLTGQGAPQ